MYVEYADTVDTYRNVITKYETLIASATAKFGKRAQALVFIKYEYLITLYDLIKRGKTAVPNLVAAANELISDIQQHYWESNGAPPSNTCAILDPGQPLVQFDPDYYKEHYFLAGQEIQTDILLAGADLLHHLQPLTPYIYAIDEQGVMRIYNRAFDLQDLIFGRNRVRVSHGSVTHPMLVHDTLRARAAGEIVFIGEEKVQAVVANTKSGHFRPPLISANVVRQYCQDMFALAERDTVVFSLFR